jgi:hypothetical protein
MSFVAGWYTINEKSLENDPAIQWYTDVIPGEVSG